MPEGLFSLSHPVKSTKSTKSIKSTKSTKSTSSSSHSHSHDIHHPSRRDGQDDLLDDDDDEEKEEKEHDTKTSILSSDSSVLGRNDSMDGEEAHDQIHQQTRKSEGGGGGEGEGEWMEEKEMAGMIDLSMEMNEKEEAQLAALENEETHIATMLKARKEFLTLREQYEERLLQVTAHVASLSVGQ